jgi:hypothetical protein
MLTRDQVVSVYRQILEREPAEEEIAAQLAGAPDLGALLRIALDSDEYAARLHERGLQARRSPAVANIFHPDLAEWTLPPGTRSPDGIAIVGREGWLFLCGGTNANLDQFVGAAELDPDWLQDWQELAGCRTAHLTFRGNQLLFESLCAPLGITSPPDLSHLPLRSYPIGGDLGSKFDPRIISVVSEPHTFHHARIVEDNSAEIEAVHGHIGMRYLYRNERAPDQRVAVVFGDSFGRGALHYQGLSWFLAQVFREVHFVWIPFGWDPDYVARVGAEVVLSQGAERFVARVPQFKVDTTRLTEETLRRKQPAAVDQVFG